MTEEVNATKEETDEAEVQAEETQAEETQAEEAQDDNTKDQPQDGPQVLEPIRESASPFISEDDTLDATVRYYVRGVKYFVENVEDGFVENDITNSFTFTCRVPNQEDAAIISQRVGSSAGATSGDMTLFKAFSDMEYVRLVRLIKDWDLSEPCTESNIELMHPDIVKGMVVALRNKLEMTAIV